MERGEERVVVGETKKRFSFVGVCHLSTPLCDLAPVVSDALKRVGLSCFLLFFAHTSLERKKRKE